MDGPLQVVIGIVLVAIGALGATATQRRLEAEGRARWVPPALVPFGVLLGAGAAFVRGWDLPVAMIAGGVVVPVVGVVARLWEVRRSSR